MKMKFFVVALAMGFAFASCGDDEPEPTVNPGTNTEQPGGNTNTGEGEGEGTGEDEKIGVITITPSEVKSTSFTVTFNCENKEAYYLPSVETTWFEQFDDLDELAEEDLAYWYERFGESYAQYMFESYEDLFFNALCVQGEYVLNEDEAEPETTYHAYAFIVNPDYTVGSEVCTEDITTKALSIQFYGTAEWHDVFVSSIFNLDGSNIDLVCDVYTDPETPGVFYFDSPYNYANIASWFGSTPEEMEQYTGNWKRTRIAIDCSNPAQVKMAIQPLGCCLAGTYGFVSGGFGYGYQVDSYGTYDSAKGEIKFNADGQRRVLWIMEKYNEGKTYGSTLEDDFVVTITKGGQPEYPYTSYYEARSNGNVPMMRLTSVRTNKVLNAPFKMRRR